MTKRVVAIHDISCFGRCSLTVALPILSNAGINCTVLPTAILSTNTGGLGNFTYRDLTEDILPVARHWLTLGLTFDAIYSGFLGSTEQVVLLEGFIEMYKSTNTFVLVDPVMGDDGKLYSTFSPDFPEEMQKLCNFADLITPNMTEAALLTGTKYRRGPYGYDYVEGLIKDLANLTKGGKVVLTGVHFNENELGAAVYEDCKLSYFMSEKIPATFPGTGDVFASVLLGKLMNGFSLAASTQIAVDFVSRCIKRTHENGSDPRFGIEFEAELLTSRL